MSPPLSRSNIIAAGTIGTRASRTWKAAALFAEPRLGAGRGVEAERRAAGQRDGVDALDRHRRIEQRAFARAGSAAANVGGGNRGLIEQHDRRAGAELGIVGMADADAGNVGDEISSQAQVSKGGAPTIPDQAPITSAPAVAVALAPARRPHASRTR